MIYCFSAFGYEGDVVTVESDIRNGLPVVDIVGLPGVAVREARNRMKAAIRNSGYEFPIMRILINLSPASERKEGSGFDLPIAISVIDQELASSQELSVMIIGELELSGRVRPVRGVITAILAGLKCGIQHFIVPKENLTEAQIPEDAIIFGVENLIETVESIAAIKGGNYSQTANRPVQNVSEEKIKWSNGVGFDFSQVRGQSGLLRALVIAAAGGHNMLVYGSPGCGKTLSLSHFSELLPDLDYDTAQQATRIYSIAGLLNHKEPSMLIRRPPFRMPHPNASLEGIIGGAGKCMPGEISLAHGGVLFLDEANQFRTAVLQSLRAPLETHVVTLSRAERRTNFPARFQLIMAINCCPCGNLGAKNRFCTCDPNSVDNYWKKLGAPLIDRLDMRVSVAEPSSDELAFKPNEDYTTEKMRGLIKQALLAQLERNPAFFPNDTALMRNSTLPPEAVFEVCSMTNEAERLFAHVSRDEGLSGRGTHALIKIARTISDLEGEEKIGLSHLEEAVLLRRWANYVPDFL